MFAHLQIYDPKERLLVGAADAALAAATAPARLLRGRASGHTGAPRRILLLRLERIGDLLMSAAAIASVRAHAPTAAIDLIVGSWNAPLAALIPGVDRVETLDTPWLARHSPGATYAALARRAWSWRARHYDLAINFEGDIRSHGLMAMAGAPVRIGFDMAGGGPLLTRRVPFDPARHTAENAARLVRAAFTPDETIAPALARDASADEAGFFRLDVPAAAVAAARARLCAPGPFIGVHASGGRAIKQWPPARFADAAARLARERGATLLLTGTPADRALVDELRAALPGDVPVIDLSGDLVGAIDLPILAAILQRCELFITGDTGPMHLAAAAGVPVVAVFGPSAPARYAPLTGDHRVVRIDLPCAPCNRIRLPPARCQGHTPDCLEGVTADAVYRAGVDLLASVERLRGSA